MTWAGWGSPSPPPCQVPARRTASVRSSPVHLLSSVRGFLSSRGRKRSGQGTPQLAVPELRAWGPGPARGLRSGQAPQEEGARQATVHVHLKKEQTPEETSSRTDSSLDAASRVFLSCFAQDAPSVAETGTPVSPPRGALRSCPDCSCYHVVFATAVPPHGDLGSAEPLEAETARS